MEKLMTIYETTRMLKYRAVIFMSMFDKQVGTEREMNDLGEGVCTVTCFELEGDEVATCRALENRALGINDMVSTLLNGEL